MGIQLIDFLDPWPKVCQVGRGGKFSDCTGFPFICCKDRLWEDLGYPGHVLEVIIRQKWSLDALTNSNGMVTCLNQEQLEVYPGQDPFLDHRALKSKPVREAAIRDT